MPHRVFSNVLTQRNPLLHTLAAWSGGVGDCYLYGYFCDAIGLPIISRSTGLPMTSKTLVLDGSDTAPVAMNTLIASIDADCSAMIEQGPWPTGFVVHRVENAVARIHVGAAESSEYDWSAVSHLDGTDVSWYEIGIGDYSSNPVVIGCGVAMDLEAVKRVEILTPAGSAPARVEVERTALGIPFSATGSGTITSAPGRLLSLGVINPAAGSTVTVHNGTSGSDPVLIPALSGASIHQLPLVAPIAFSVGLHLVFSGGTPTVFGLRAAI